MKTSEFIKRVKKLGYEIAEINNFIFVNSRGIALATISKIKQYKIETYNIAEAWSDELFDLCIKYAKTPIDEREGEEKFYLKKMKSFYSEDKYMKNHSFLNFVINDKSFERNTRTQTDKCQTQFTQKEIDKIKEEQHTDLSEFKQIPVEEY